MMEYTIRINLRCTSSLSLSLSLSPRVWVMDRVPRRGWWESEHQAGLGNVVTEVLLDSVWKKDNDMDPITDGYSILYVSIIFFLLRWGFSFFPVVQRHIFFFFSLSLFFSLSFSLFFSSLSLFCLFPKKHGVNFLSKNHSHTQREGNGTQWCSCPGWGTASLAEKKN